MTTQPEALRLAKKLEEGYVAHETVLYPAAAELRRLHSLNKDLVAALHSISLASVNRGCSRDGMGKYARAAIAKAEGEQNEL